MHNIAVMLNEEPFENEEMFEDFEATYVPCEKIYNEIVTLFAIILQTQSSNIKYKLTKKIVKQC